MSVLLGEDKETSPAGVNMMPHVVLSGDSVDGVMVIERSHNSGGSNGIDEEWSVTGLEFLNNLLFKSFMVHGTSPSVAWDLFHVVHTHSGDHGSSVDRVMRLS